MNQLNREKLWTLCTTNAITNCQNADKKMTPTHRLLVRSDFVQYGSDMIEKHRPQMHQQHAAEDYYIHRIQRKLTWRIKPRDIWFRTNARTTVCCGRAPYLPENVLSVKAGEIRRRYDTCPGRVCEGVLANLCCVVKKAVRNWSPRKPGIEKCPARARNGVACHQFCPTMKMQRGIYHRCAFPCDSRYGSWIDWSIQGHHSSRGFSRLLWS